MSIQHVTPGIGNTYIPSMEATKGLTIGFARNVEDFKVNQWVQVIRVDKSTGLYRRMTNEECIRILGGNANSAVWAPGTVSPEFAFTDEKWGHETYTTTRYRDGFVIDDHEAKQADLKLLMLQSKITASRVMTRRSNAAIATLFSTSNHEDDHIVNIQTNTEVGGSWMDALPSTPYILKSLNYAQYLILKHTLGNVKAPDLQMIMSPTVARTISESQEIIDYLKGSIFASEQLQGKQKGYNSMFRIPDQMYGIKIIVDDTVSITTPKGQAASPAFTMPDDKVVICARPGSIEGGAPESPNFSSIVFLMKEEMTVEQKVEPENRRTLGYVTEEWDCRLIAPSSAVMLTNIT